MNTYIISFEADHFRKRLIHDTLSDNVPEVARANQEMGLANDDVKAGVLAIGGKVIELGASDECRIEIPVDRLPDFQKIIGTYAKRLDSSVSVGIGEKLSESAKALVAAKIRGGNKTVIYDKTVNDTINEVKQPDEGPLMKSFEQPDAPAMQTEEHSEAEAARAVASEGDDLEQQRHPLEDDFHQVAGEHEQAEQNQAEDKSEDYQKIREAVAKTLLKLRQQLPVLSQLKQTNPEAFASITELAQGVVVMAREMKPLAKAESLSGIKPSGDEGGVSDYSHLLKPEQQSKYKLTITHIPGEPEDYLKGKLRADLTLREGTAYNKKDPTPGHGAPASWHREESPSKVGVVMGYLFGEGQHSFLEPHSLIDEKHRNQGLGTAMYQALVAHAANVHGASQVKGGIHSAASHSVHNKIAQKFGSKIEGGYNDEEDHGDYQYALNKSEADEDDLHDLYFTVPTALDKAAISEIKGKPTDRPTVFDYSHLLPEDIQKTHTLKVHTKLNPATVERYFTAVFDRKGSRSKFPHGKVTAYIVGKHKHAIEPHSQLDKSYRGKGIGKAMYKSLFAHAINQHGISRVEGSHHSADAHKVQQSIAKEFGIKVVGSKPIDPVDDGGNELPYDSYHFTYKGEIPSIDDGKLHPLYFLAEDIKKAESPKVFKEKGGGFPNELSIPSKNHPNRKAFDQNFMLSLQDRYGDKGSIRPIPIETTREGNSGAGVVNKPRYNLYLTMLRHGDEIPPVVAQHLGGTNYQMVDGTHRLNAARKAGLKEINAYVLNTEVKKNDDSLNLDKDQFPEDVEETKQGGPLEKEEECGDDCCDFDNDQLSAGINYEVSNGLNEKDASESAMDNLAKDPDFYKGKTLKKEAMTGHHFKAMPVGTLVNGKLKVRHADGRAGWKGVKAGMIQGQERGAALFGHNSHPVSSREPSSK